MRTAMRTLAVLAGLLGLAIASVAYWKLGITNGNGAISIDGVAVYGIDKLRGWLFVATTVALSFYLLWIGSNPFRRQKRTGKEV